jgi:type IX secretion system PorP/SprF family membrane protein
MKRILKIFILILLPVNLLGQLSPVTSQYVLNPLSINPAYAGNRDALNLALFYRRQWIGIQGAPATMTLEADAPFMDSKLGLGFIITNDKIGVTKETHLMTNYSYKISIEKGILSFGLGAGLTTTNTSWSDLVVLDPGDESFLTNSKVFIVPDFNFGIYYSQEGYFASLSIPKLLTYKFNFDKNKYNTSFDFSQFNYILHSGVAIKMNDRMKLLPSLLLSYSAKEKILFDINAYASWNDKLWGGFSYRNGRSVGALVQFAINSQLKAAYTYDFELGSLGRYTSGSHEIMIRYEFRYKIDAVSPVDF